MANPDKPRIIDITAATGLKKSSVQRHQKGLERRNQYAESSLWETSAGAAWLERLVVAVVHHFGIQQGVGAESLSRFFKAIHIETHVGISPSALRSLKGRLNETIAAYAAAQAEHCHPQPGQGICVGADETFFDLPIRKDSGRRQRNERGSFDTLMMLGAEGLPKKGHGRPPLPTTSLNDRE